MSVQIFYDCLFLQMWLRKKNEFVKTKIAHQIPVYYKLKHVRKGKVNFLSSLQFILHKKNSKSILY